jgi:PKD domain
MLAGASLLLAAPVYAAAPTASITAAPNPTIVKQTVNFDGSGSTDSDGTIAKYEWDLNGDGSFETNTGTTPSASTQYTTVGQRTVRLRVTDDAGETGSASVVVDVQNTPPVAKIGFAPLNLTPGQDRRAPLIGQQLAFTSLSTDRESTNATNDDTIKSYQWVDVSTAPGKLFSQQKTPPPQPGYATAGDKRVALHITDENGATADDVATLRVNTPPVADFVTSPETPVQGEQVTFYQAASDPDPMTADDLPNVGALVNFEWDLDGNPSNGPNGDGFEQTGPRAATAFPATGAKQVRLRVTDGGGARTVTVKQVQVVTSRPTAAFGFAPAFPLPGQAVTFTSSSSPSAGHQLTSQEWDFDYDPAKAFTADASGATARIAFASPGQKLVALRVTETGGGVSLATRALMVNSPVVAPPPARAAARMSVINMTVRIAGRPTATGARLTLVQVRAPKGATVKMRCRGHSCPVRSTRVKMKRTRIRFKRLERPLRAGTQIVFDASRKGFIGRRVTYTIRRGKVPSRKDSCIRPGATKASACPA